MSDNLKNIMVTVCFLVLTFGLFVATVLVPDNEISCSERRRLSTVPTYTLEKLFNGKLFSEFEKYVLDQFVFRDTFRSFKAFSTFSLFRQKDYSGLYFVDNSIYKLEYPLNGRSVEHVSAKLNSIYNQYLQGADVYYAIIPDKNYFVAEKNGYPSLDYDKLQKIMQHNTKNMKYINLFHTLSAADYYNTDLHWRQDKILPAANMLLNKMGMDTRLAQSQYTQTDLYPFLGSYYGQAARKGKPDSLTYLTNKTLENALVYDHQSGTYSKVYRTEMFGGIDSYDLFLSGAKPLLTLINANADTEKELILFRDSFGSSIAPLLLSAYSRITLIDLRYISSDILEDYVDFSFGQDALFLYSTQILNNSYMLK